jgi:CheY-like chemotaxis protein
MMGGDIRVESETGKGTTFTIWLPEQVQDRSQSLQELDTGTPERMAAKTVPTSSSLGTVLAIDDDPSVRDLMQRFLGREGFKVVTAEGGAEGLRLAKELLPDAIVLDVMMPSTDGWAVLSSLKSDPELATIPVVMVTIVDDKNLGYALGASDYLLKPIDYSYLTTLLQKYRLDATSNSIMVVEDNPENREMIGRQLTKAGWQVLEAENGRRALDVLHSEQPSVILLDLMMPEMDGFEFIDELRQHPQWRSIPVIVLTAKDLTQEDKERLDGQIQRIYQKGSYNRQTLLNEIRTLVDTHSRDKARNL